VREVAPALIRSAQLCDARPERPVGDDAIIREARSGRLPPGKGALPLCDLLDALPDGVALSVEVPLADGADPEEHVRTVFKATRNLLNAATRERLTWPPPTTLSAEVSG
jgi:sugar phosphate isomerase/epimerase